MRVLFALMSLFAFELQADSIKRADEPRDTTIKVIVDGTEYCYSPVFTNNEGCLYRLLLLCKACEV